MHIVFIVETKGLTKSQIDQKINGYIIMEENYTSNELDLVEVDSFKKDK